MNTYEIWSEGFHVNEGRSTAHYHGQMQANSFEEACQKFANENDNFDHYFDRKRMTHWSCRLFDNEADARASFG